MYVFKWFYDMYRKWPDVQFNLNSAEDTNQAAYVRYPEDERRERQP